MTAGLMNEDRIRDLLLNLEVQFELLQSQNGDLNEQVSALTADVVRLQALLDQHGVKGTAIHSAPGNCGTNIVFFKGHRTPSLPVPKAHQWDLVLTPTSLDGEKAGGSKSVAFADDEVDLQSVGISGSTDQQSTVGQTSFKKEFELWPEWTRTPLRQGASYVSIPRSVNSYDDDGKEHSLRKVKYGAELRSSGFLQHLVARPSSPRQIIWDMLTMVFMSIDVLLVPMQVFPLPETAFLNALDWLTVGFWTVDIFNNFFMGFHKRGVFEMRPSQIARRYARRFLVVDLSVVIVDWMVVLYNSKIGENIGYARIFKYYRAARLLRMLRFWRLAKILKLFNRLSELIGIFHSDVIKILVDISRLFVLILVTSHFLACGWYAIGISEVGQSGQVMNHWVEKFIADQGRDPPLGYRYLTSLHWSLTHFTQGAMEVVPRNAVERIYAVVVLLIAVVAFSGFVSSITSSMTRLRMMNIQRSKQRDDISRYILEHRISLGVGNRIMELLMQRDSQAPLRLHGQDVPLFKSLPEALRLDMDREAFLPFLCPHPFFHHYHVLLDDAGLATICHTAMEEFAATKGESIFNLSDTATHMFFIQSGKGKYSIGAAKHNDVVNIEAGGMLSEAVLWVPWDHSGCLLVVEHVEAAKLNSAVMRGVMKGQPAARAAQAYALQFLELQLRQKNLTDLPIEMDDALEMAQIAWSDIENEQNHIDKSVMTSSGQRNHLLRGFMAHLRRSFQLARHSALSFGSSFGAAKI